MPFLLQKTDDKKRFAAGRASGFSGLFDSEYAYEIIDPAGKAHFILLLNKGQIALVTSLLKKMDTDKNLKGLLLKLISRDSNLEERRSALKKMNLYAHADKSPDFKGVETEVMDAMRIFQTVYEEFFYNFSVTTTPSPFGPGFGYEMFLVCSALAGINLQESIFPLLGKTGYSRREGKSANPEGQKELDNLARMKAEEEEIKRQMREETAEFQRRESAKSRVAKPAVAANPVPPSATPSAPAAASAAKKPDEAVFDDFKKASAQFQQQAAAAPTAPAKPAVAASAPSAPATKPAVPPATNSGMFSSFSTPATTTAKPSAVPQPAPTQPNNDASIARLEASVASMRANIASMQDVLAVMEKELIALKTKSGSTPKHPGA